MPLAHTQATLTNVSLPVGTTTRAISAAAAWTVVQVDIDRTLLNTLTAATGLVLDVQYSIDTTRWLLAAEMATVGGPIPQAARLGGGNLTAWTLGFSVVGQQFPAGAQWRLMSTVTGPTAVTVSGTVSWQ